MMLTRLVAVALVAALGSGMAVAGTTGKIVGEVKNAQTGEALVGASVVVEGTRLGAATNIDGYYVILNVPPGKYTLAVSAVGYVRKRVSDLSVSVDLTSTANFNVTSEAVQVGEEVVVTAERPVVRKDLTSSEARVDAPREIAALLHTAGEFMGKMLFETLQADQFDEPARPLDPFGVVQALALKAE